MDMSPISAEYERELRRPMQSIVTGKIATLVLIQLQFVKKELLVAMQAIDDLFNANQVNLQLLAITPAVLSILSLQILSRTLLTALRATSRGRKVESSAAVHMELREGLRTAERLLYLSDGFDSGPVDAATMGQLLSSLYRLQSTLVSHSSFFDAHLLRQLQEDLRDLSLPQLSAKQRLAIVERISRAYPFMQPARRWGGGLMQ
jgi:nuclear-control-of-ATPase protein 2